MQIRLWIVWMLWRTCCSGAEEGLPVFDPSSCYNMCRSNQDCPEKAACMPVINNQNCGVCVCVFGYKPQNDDCVKMDPSDGESAPTLATVPPTTVRPKPKPIATTSNPFTTVDLVEQDLETGEVIPGLSEEETATNANLNEYDDLEEYESGPKTPSSGFGTKLEISTNTVPLDPTTTTPASSTPEVTDAWENLEWNCTNYECNEVFAEQDDVNPLIIRTARLNNCERNLFVPPKKCPNLSKGSGCAAGGECLHVTDQVSYCMCPYSRAGTQCHVEKDGECSKTLGIVPDFVYPGKRYRHIRNKHSGSVFGRHFAPSLEHCVRLCEWAGRSRCRSINFGPINGQNVCELLTVWANIETPLHAWLESERGWTYACCFGRISTRWRRFNNNGAI